MSSAAPDAMVGAAPAQNDGLISDEALATWREVQLPTPYVLGHVGGRAVAGFPASTFASLSYPCTCTSSVARLVRRCPRGGAAAHGQDRANHEARVVRKQEGDGSRDLGRLPFAADR